MSRSAFVLLATLVVVVAALPAFAQLHPNLERGFSSEKAFQVGDVDQVNLYNGNVSVTVPLGRPLVISEDLSLSLTAVYNSKLWDIRKHKVAGGTASVNRLHPNRVANAGFGWVVSLGRLIGEDETDVNDGIAWRYLAADGAIHEFEVTLHGEASAPDVYYTRDNSYLRLRKVSSQWWLEFPDGSVQEFDPWMDGTIERWRLSKTRDAQGNFYSVTYGTDSWTITDQYNRQVTVDFAPTRDPNDPADAAVLPYDYLNSESAVHTVTIPGFQGAAATYTFDYEPHDVRRGYCGSEEIEDIDQFVGVPLLASITLTHGQQVIGSYNASYDVSVVSPGPGTLAQSCKAGTLTALTLPTQAAIRWQYGTYTMQAGCRGGLVIDASAGVIQRTYDAPSTGEFAGEPDAVWTYQPQMTAESGESYQCGNTTYVGPPPPAEMTNTVTAPSGDQTVNYFSVWPVGGQSGPHGELWKEFGLPLSRRSSDSGADTYLSMRVCEGSCASSNHWKRSTHVAYDRDSFGEQFDTNRRVVRSRTVFHDDADRWTKTENQNFDGVGHYRTTVTSGNFGGATEQRSTTTNYNVRDTAVSSNTQVLDTGRFETGYTFNLPPVTHTWLLDTFSSATATAGTSSTKQLSCFDPLTGALKGTRVFAGATSSSTDLITVYERSTSLLNGNTKGAIIAESYYGGDAKPLAGTGATAFCDYIDLTSGPNAPQPRSYRFEHTYSYGVRKTTTAIAENGSPYPFKTLDIDIDVSGLPATVRDTAGVSTDYTFDASGRLTLINQPSYLADINYSYTSATTASRARVTATQAATSGTMTRELQFDSSGRPVVEKRNLGSSTLRSRKTTYDNMGRTTSVTEWGSNSATTYSDFDAFGRPGTITAPDGATTGLTYAGAREVTRTRTYQSPTGSRDTTVVETSDSFGRLVSVKEESGSTSVSSPVGTDVTATYTYDVGDRLTTVGISVAGGPTQTRTFSYDGRGFLTEETHPELGAPITYSYDARGYTVAKAFTGTSAFNITNVYDGAERLRTVKTGASSRVTKEFEFGASANAALGRLTVARRYNYLPNSSNYYLVSEIYDYDTGGRVSTKNTYIDKVVDGTPMSVRAFTEAPRLYNDLGLPEVLRYPQCDSCSSPARDVTFNYSYGALSAIPGFISSTTYGPNGMVTAVVHANGITDYIDASSNGLPRPAAIRFAGFTTCTAPVISTEPIDQGVASGGSVTFVTTSDGSGTLTYQWASRPVASQTWTTVAGAIGPTLTVTNVTQDMYYRLTVSNSCGSDVSRDARVTVYTAPGITTQPQSVAIDRGGAATLEVVAAGAGTLTYQWYRGAVPDTSDPIAAPAGTSSILSTGALFSSASYWVRVTNTYGSVNSVTAEVTVRLAAPQNVTVTQVNPTSVKIRWDAVPDGSNYCVFRKTPTTQYSSSCIGNGLEHTQVTVPNEVYTFYVTALDTNLNRESLPSSTVYAATYPFSTVVAGMPMTNEALDEILAAVNLLRQKSTPSQPALTWADLVTAPVPANGVVVRAAHLQALRNAANSARALWGSLPFPFAETLSPGLTPIKAQHVTELQGALKK